MPMTDEEKQKLDEALTLVARYTRDLKKPGEHEKRTARDEEIALVKKQLRAMEAVVLKSSTDSNVGEVYRLKKVLAVLDPPQAPTPQQYERQETPALYCAIDGVPFEAGKCRVCGTRRGYNPFEGLRSGLERLKPQLSRR